jgi:uncharacterized phiE125 gp8 family phage protein
MALRLITAPAAEPVTLQQAKDHLRVDHSADDTLISGLIAASRVYCEQFTARAFVTQTWELVLDEFPANEILIPLPPLQSVTSVKYDDADGFEQTLSALEYTVDDASQPGWIVPAVTGWSPVLFDGINAVRIRFVAGYPPGTNSPIDLAANVPQSIKAAMLLHIGQLYDQREDIVVGTIVNKVPTGGVEHMLRQFRVALGMA